jgi:hypothetical protein
MSGYEAGLLIDAYNAEYKEGWERQRWVAYVNAAAAGAKVKKPEDLLKFEWEKEQKKEAEKKTPEQLLADRERLTKKFPISNYLYKNI